MTTHTDLIARLRVIANAIADGNYSELTMRIPAEPDRDADIVVMRSALALESLEQQVAALTKELDEAGSNCSMYKQQVLMLTKERDELEISNAFAHGEWRAVKDQLAALTKERNHLQSLTVVNESLPVPALRRQLAASQADNARLRDALESIRSASDAGDWPDEFETIAIPADDSALMERLKQDREQLIDDWTTTIATCYKSDDLLTAEQVVDLLCSSAKKADAIRGIA